MAKLYFRYGAMNSGKSTALLQAAHNYEERGHHVMLAKPMVDVRGDDAITSRLGVERRVDFLIDERDDVAELFASYRAHFEYSIACLLVDEAQFLTRSHINQLFTIAVTDNIPVLAYGIRTDFRTDAFPGSARLLEIAHSLEELKTICRCGRKAIFNGRTVDGRFIAEGEQVALDGIEVRYESLCGSCYLEKVRALS